MHYQKTSQSLTLLKLLVYLMGIVLVVGTVMILFIIYKRNSDIFTYPDSLQLNFHNKCSAGNIDLQLDSEIETFQVIDNKLFILTKPLKGFQEIIIVNHCQGDSEEKRIGLRLNNSNSYSKEKKKLIDLIDGE